MKFLLLLCLVVFTAFSCSYNSLSDSEFKREIKKQADKTGVCLIYIRKKTGLGLESYLKDCVNDIDESTCNGNAYPDYNDPKYKFVHKPNKKCVDYFKGGC